MKLLDLILFKDSRKVGFGIWLFLVANAFLMKAMITSGDWMGCMMLAATLIGGGTVADKYLVNKKGTEDKNARSE